MSQIDALLTTIKLNQLVVKEFIIPDYQRAFRWQKDEIFLFLNDIYEAKKQENIICLQPLVVKTKGKRGNNCELIDGQQRLTTIFLIISYLNNTIYKKPKDLFTIDYDSRNICLEAVISDPFNRNSIDSELIKNGYGYISDWFDEIRKEDSSIEENMYAALAGNVFFIWYEVFEQSTINLLSNANENDSIEMFLRLNIGKIKLSDSELIKAWLLNQINLYENNIDKQNNIKITTMKEWDDIEQKLMNDDFWFFLNTSYNNHQNSNRITFIFEKLIGIEEEQGRYILFYKFIDKFEKETAMDVWLQVKSLMLTFMDWYENRLIYHYVGLLTCMGEKISTIIKFYDKSKNQKQFKKELVILIKKNLGIDSVDFDITQYLQNIDYEDSKKQNIKNILLSFNIFSIIQMKHSYNRFPFHNFHMLEWDIEHIKPQTEKELQKRDDLIDWINLNKSILKVSKEDESFIKSFNNIETYDDETLKEKYKKLIAIVEDNLYTNQTVSFSKFSKHSISNLALLDKSTNCSYKNSVFYTKRQIILEKETSGTFIMPCTRNIFLKVYSTKNYDPFRWNDEDMIDYFEALKNCLETIGEEK